MIASKQFIMDGNTVGLLGGSFNPPHDGHVHITHQALQSFRFKKVWWLVSPGNPLKIKSPTSIDIRVNECKKIIQDPRVMILDIENRLNTQFTAETLRKLFVAYPNTRFVWLMGADNLINFHKWEKWTWIMENIPVGVMARPGDTIRAGLSLTALRYQKFRVKSSYAGLMPFMNPPVWSLLGGPTRDVSSTQIRCNVQRK